jgi:diguanylate cyclase (GGDEF)-like protein/PAS domain S-box-containing protein
MTLKTKIWLLLGALMGVVLTADLAVSYRKMTGELRSEAEYDAKTVYGFMMATRRIYQKQFVESGLPINESTVGFLPAHSFSRISRDFANWNQNGIVFNTVSDLPRNPGNQADRFELEAMAWFRANPKDTQRMRNIVDDKGVGYLLYTAPVWIEPYCLKCHGAIEDAPGSIREHYPTAYGYRVGDLRGVVSIKIPMEKFDRRLRELWGGQLIKSLAGYLVLFLALGFLLDRLVTRRLSRLQMGAYQIAAGEYGTRVAQDGRDEIAGLAGAFNRMADEVQTRDQTLGKLSQAVEQSPESIVITDLNACIEYVNESFVRNTGYSRGEALGANPRILRSGKTPAERYQALWACLTQGRVWQGEFINRRMDGSEYIEAAVISPVRTADGRVTHYLAIKQDITERKQAEAQIHNLAYFDALTGLPNRTLLMDRLAQLLAVGRRSDYKKALVLVNIDRFKNINDARGHALGDALLKSLGGRLTSLLREGDTLARLAADEFALLLPSLSRNPEQTSRDTLSVANKIHALLRQHFDIGGEDITLTASLGITLFPEDPNERPDQILRRADNALHRAKEAGGNRTAFFETGMGEAAEQRFRVERELRRAIPAGELRLFLQPQVDGRGQVVGAEALVRWQHPERGLIPPGVFVPLAEESDLIVELDVWVLTEACRLMAREDMAGYPLRLSVNLSPRHFRQSGFVPWLRDLLAATGADPTHLTLEMTEGLMIDNLNEVVAKMSELAALGIHFSLDDFGTGYSCLAYIKRLPIHELKIDKTFVQDAPSTPDDAALVETILAVARHMHLKVVAEGVETEEQAAFLNARSTVIHQGYFYGRPEPAQTWIMRWRGENAP